MHKKQSIFLLFSFFSLITIAIFAVINLTKIEAATCNWTGAVNGNWSNAGNWSCGSVSQGDTLVFPASATTKTVVNDLAANFDIQYLIIEAEDYTFSGNVIDLTDSMNFNDNNNSGTLNFGIPINTLTNPLTIEVNDPATVLNISSVISGSQNVYKTGTGELSFTGTTANTYSGETTVIDGKLTLNKSNGGSGVIALSSSIINIGDDTGENDSAILELAFKNQFNSSATVNILSDGWLKMNNDTNIENNIANVVSNSGTLSLSGNSTITNQLNLTGSYVNTLNGSVKFSGSTINCDRTESDYTEITGVGFTLVNSVEFVTSYEYEDFRCYVTAPLFGSSSIAITGNSINFAGDNISYTGVITVNANSRLLIRENNALGSTVGNTTVLDTGVVSMYNNITVPENFSITGDGNNLNGAITSYLSTNTLSGTITLSGANVSLSYMGDAVLDITGVITGSASSRLALSRFNGGNGELRLSNNNTFTTPLVQVNDANLVKTANADIIPNTSTLRLNTNSTFFLQNFNEEVGLMRGDSGSIIELGSATLTTGSTNVANITLNSIVNGTGGITKVGTTAYRLLANNTYTGTTNVNNGKLLISGNQPNSNVVVGSSGIIGGLGTMGSLTSSGGVQPGTSPGTINITGNLILNTSNVLTAEINGTVAGTSYDRINVTGNFSLNNSTLTLLVGYVPSPGDSYTLIQASGTRTGIFGGLPHNSNITIGSDIFTIAYTSNSVVLYYGDLEIPGGDPETPASTPVSTPTSASVNNLNNTGTTITIYSVIGLFVASLATVTVVTVLNVRKSKKKYIILK